MINRTSILGGLLATSFLFFVLDPSAGSADQAQVAAAKKLLHEYKNEAAAKILRKALEDDPRNGPVWGLYGEALDSSNESKSAIEAYTKAIALGEKGASVYHARGMAYSHLGNFETAIADFTTALKIGTPNSDARAFVHCDRADAELSSKRFCQAAEDYTMYFKFTSSADWARYTHRARAYAGCGKIPEAIHDMSIFLGAAPKLRPKQIVGGYQYRSELYSKSKQYDKAISDLSAALVLDPDRTIILRDRAKLYDLAGKKDLAEKDRAKSKQIDKKLYGDF